MKAMHWFAVAGLAIAAPVVAAQGDDDFSTKVINQPLPASLNVSGLRQQPRVVSAQGVEGGKVKRVPVPGAAPQPWSVQLQSPTTQPVKKGDRLVIAFYARTLNMPAGQKAKIANVAIQGSTAPYGTVFGQPIEVGDQFEFHQVQGKADKDYAAGAINASLQLATGHHTIDFGPLFIINMDRK